MAMVMMMVTGPRAGPHTPATGVTMWTGIPFPTLGEGRAASRRAAPCVPPRSSRPASWVPPPPSHTTITIVCHPCEHTAIFIASTSSGAPHVCSAVHVTITITAGSDAHGPTA